MTATDQTTSPPEEIPHGPRLEPIPDLKPFAVDPLILGRFNGANASVPVVAISVSIVTALAVFWSASSTDLFLWKVNAAALWNDFWHFVTRSPSNRNGASVPYLRDFPSIILTFTIAASVCLVYSLYKGAEKLHSDMERTHCIKYNEEGHRALVKAVNEVNLRLQRWGKFSPLAFALAGIGTVIMNLALGPELFEFLGRDLYAQWWASLHPLRAGGVVWVVFGAVGIYMVYAEAVVGLTYVAFLRRLRNDYQFRANMLNPDGFFGWHRLRQLITNMQVGALCTLLSAWALSFFLEAAAGRIAATLVILIFVGVVMYVFVSVNGNFRRQVRQDKQAQREAVADEIASYEGRHDSTATLLKLLAYKRLDYIAQIPSTPIRQRWLVAGILSIFGPLSAITVQVVKYFST